MKMIKMLISSFLLSFTLIGSEGEWYPVEKAKREFVEREEERANSWVLFVANFEGDKIQAQFPEEPTYSYSPTGDLEVESSKDGQLFILSLQKEPPQMGNLSYKIGEKWVREQVLPMDGYFCCFKTVSDQPDLMSHNLFIDSFSIEKKR